MSEFGDIDLYYGDESGVCLRPYVPYGWQFRGEKVTCPSQHGGRLNCFALYCFALLRRDNTCFFAATEGRVTGQWLGEQIDRFSLTLTRLTLIVLDNAPVHKKMVNDYGECWEERGLFVGFLPPYSPHLNIVEILWKKLKYEWLDVRDYASAGLCEQGGVACARAGDIVGCRGGIHDRFSALHHAQDWSNVILHDCLNSLSHGKSITNFRFAYSGWAMN